MSKKRSLLFYVNFPNGKVTAFPIDGLEISTMLKESFNLIFKINLKINKMTQDKDFSEDYHFLDWHLNVLEPNIKINQVPKPGIIIAILKEKIDAVLIYGHAIKIKNLIENSNDLQQHNILNSFISGAKGEFEPHAYDVFLSYAREDINLANELFNLFAEAGLKCFMDKKSLNIGTIWENDTRKALLDSLAEVLLLTPNSINSTWIMCELGACWVLDKRIFPAIMYIKPESLPDPIKKFQYITIDTTLSRHKLRDDIVQFCGIS